MSDTRPPLASSVAARIREMLIAGEFKPGDRLTEQHLAAKFGISRNTLREVFRELTSEGLLTHRSNRGVFVETPDEAAVIDIYRVRSVIQLGAVQAATRHHPAFSVMQRLADEAKEAAASGNWLRVGTINMAFHRAMVEFCDSPRLSAWFDRVLAELRLVFGQLEDVAHVHEPFVPMNATLVDLIASGRNSEAQDHLEDYLRKSEKAVIAAFQRGRRQLHSEADTIRNATRPERPMT